MWRRRAAFLLLLLAFPLLLAGCWDRKELEEVAFVLMLGVDKGEESEFAVTAAIAIPARMAGGDGGGGGGEEKPYVVTTVEGPTVSGAMAMMSGYIDRRLSLDHTKALFMGEELAREGALRGLDEMIRFRQSRRTILYVVTKGKAVDFLQGMKPELERNPQRYLEQMTYGYRQTGMLPAEGQLQSFVTATNTGYASPVAYYAALKEESEEKEGEESSQAESGFLAGQLPRQGGPNVEVLGAAAFKGERMVGSLTGDEIRLVLMVQDRFTRGFFSVPDPMEPDKHVSLDVRRGRPINLAVDLSGSRPRVTGRIILEAEVVSMPSSRDYTEPELQTELEQAFSDHLEERMADLIRKTQEWESDIFGLGRWVVRQFDTVDRWNQFNWPEQYPDADIAFTVDTTLRRFGVQLSPHTSKE